MSGNIISPLHLQILPARLVLASVRKEHLADVMHAIVRIFIDVDYCDGLRSTFTPVQVETTNDERWLIEDAAGNPPRFPMHLLTVCPMIWRALEVTVGADGDSEGALANTVHMIAKPLAEHGISIFQVSTFDADYTLVPEDRLAGALEALRSVFRVNVDEETREDLRRRSASTVSSSRASVHSTTALSSSAVASSLVMTDDGSAPVDVDASTAIFNMDGLGTSLDAAPSSPTSTTATRHEFSRPIGDSPLAIASFRLGSGRGTSSMWMSVFRLMFYNPTKRLFSITMVDDQVSMVVERDSLAGFPLEWMSVYQLEHVDEAWSLIAIGEGLGFEESGIVARYTGQLKQERVQCFYLSTFFHDLVLVPSTRCEQVLAVLNRG